MVRFSAPFVPTLVNNINGIHLARSPLVFFSGQRFFLAAHQKYPRIGEWGSAGAARKSSLILGKVCPKAARILFNLRIVEYLLA